MSSPSDTWIAHKCLIYWQSGLDSTQRHTFTWKVGTFTQSARFVLFDSFDVLRVEGGTRYEPLVPLTKGLPPSRISTPTWAATGTLSATSNSHSNLGSNSNTPALTGAIVGGIAGALLVLSTIIGFVIAARRRQRLKERVFAAFHSQDPT